LTGGFRSPALFVLISFLIPALILALINKDGLAAFLYLAMMGGWLFYVFLLHLAVTKLMSGRGPFQATFRAAAYASFTNLFGFVPFLGLIAHIFGLYLTGQGLVAAHRLNLGKAILAVVLVLAALIAANLLLARTLFQSLWSI
ncbi:MAG: YIP1 family protein, partial [Deltaproteobacteria bacterium]|nr:YIP1 family protein [Deltaproteobacteria bacterium]